MPLNPNNRHGRHVNPPLKVHMRTEDKELLAAIAKERGSSSSEVVRDLIRHWIGREDAEYPQPPVMASDAR